MRYGILFASGVGMVCRLATAQSTYCEQLPNSDYSELRTAAQECGTLSKGLTAIADYCFDLEGKWHAGYIAVYTRKGQSPPTEPTSRCAEAVQFCRDAAAMLNAHHQMHDKNDFALNEMSQSRNGKKFPLRPDLLSGPDTGYSCDSRVQADLRRAAQNRMAVAQRHQAIAEAHVSFKSWLWSENLQCKNRQLEEERVKREREEAERRRLANEQRQRDEEARLRKQQQLDDQKRAEQTRVAAARTDPRNSQSIDPESDRYKLRPGAAGSTNTRAVDPNVAAAQARAAEAERRMQERQEQARQAFAQGEEHRQRAAEMIRTGRGDAISETLQGQLANIRGTALQGGNTQAAAAINRSQARLARTQAAVGAGVQIAGSIFQAIAAARERDRLRREAAEERAAQREEAERLAKIEQARADALERQAQAELARAQEEARVARHLAVAATLKSDTPSGAATATPSPTIALRPVDATGPAASPATPPISPAPTSSSAIVLRPIGVVEPRPRRVLVTAPAGCAIKNRDGVPIVANVAREVPATLRSLSLRADCNAEAHLLDSDSEPPLVVLPLKRGREAMLAIPPRTP